MVMIMKYIDMILEHTETVKSIWKTIKFSDNFPYKNNCAFVSAVDFLIENHDNSRFSDYELESAAKNFFPSEDCYELDAEYSFEKVCRHHNFSNPHHFEWWIENKDIMNAPDYVKHMFLCEMICDWAADAQKAKRYIEEYYEKANEALQFDEDTNRFIFLLINILRDEV